MDIIKQNATFDQFIKESFDVKEFTTQAIHQEVGITDQLLQIAEGITFLNKQLRDQVCAHYQDLLSHATAVETLEEVLKDMQIHVQSLLSAVERLRMKVIEPYQKISSSMTTLSRLQSACDLLRTIVRVSSLSKRLEIQMRGGREELTKCAQTLSELGHLMEGADLTNLEIVTKDQVLIRNSRKEVEHQAKAVLLQGMESQNHSQVGTALQVFHYLGILPEMVQQVSTEALNRLEGNIRETLNVRNLSQLSMNMDSRGITPGRAAMPTMGSASAFKANLWINLEKLIDDIYLLCCRIHHLQKVLSKKQDPVSHMLFSDILAQIEGVSDNNIASFFLKNVTVILRKEFMNAGTESTFIKQAFEEEYPKFLRLHSDLWQRLHQFSSSQTFHLEHAISKNVETVLLENVRQDSNFDLEDALRDTLAPFENAYLSRSLSRLFDPINLKFASGDDPPTADDVEVALRVITSELNIAAVDKRLAITVSKNIIQTVHLFVAKCEQMLAINADATQVIGPPTQEQLRNICIIDLLDFFEKRIKQILKELNPNVPPEAVNIISSSLPAVHEVMNSAFQPLFAAIEGAIESIILTIHDEDFSMTTVPGGEGFGVDISAVSSYHQCSLYMRELQNFVARIHLDYFSRCSSTDFMMERGKILARRTLDLFLRHATLVRPLGDGGKRKLAADCAQMELCLSPLCSQLNELGTTYRMLRAFRPLLFQTPEHIIQSSAVREALPASMVLHVLFSFSPPELRSPHQTADWSIVHYSKWLDEHTSEIEHLAFIKGALESYVNFVRQRQGKEFSQIYPLMLDYLQNAMLALH